MASRELVIELVPDVPRIGLWCDRCLTSARYEVDVWAFGVGTPHIITMISRCDRCDDDD